MKPALIEIKIADLDAFKTFVERVDDFIGEYAWHLRSCAAIDGDGYWRVGNPDCTCGYDDDRRKLAEALGA